jgi:hypothetical protein
MESAIDFLATDGLDPAPATASQPGANTKGSLPGGFHGLWLAERQKLRQQRPCPTVGYSEPFFATVRSYSGVHRSGMDLGNRVERPSARHRTPTRGKARHPNLHRAEQRHQSPGALIFDGPLRAAALAASPAAAMILRLRLNEMDLHAASRCLPSSNVSPIICGKYSAAAARLPTS